MKITSEKFGIKEDHSRKNQSTEVNIRVTLRSCRQGENEPELYVAPKSERLSYDSKCPQGKALCSFPKVR